MHLHVDYINEHFSKGFGQMVKMHRHLAKLTLRAFAQKAGLSHTLVNKIEHGLVFVTPESYEKITSALQVTFLHDDELNNLFFENKRMITDAIYYVSLPNIVPIMERLEEHETYYLNSTLLLEYLVLFIGVYNYPHHGKIDKTAKFIEAVDVIADMLDGQIHEFYTLYKGVYHYHLKEHDKALELYHEGLDRNPNGVLTAMYYYSLGRAYSDAYKITQSNQYFKKALQAFEHQNNMTRAVFTRLYIAINRMKMFDFDNLLEEFKFIENYTLREKITGLTNTTMFNIVIYHILNNEFTQAIKKAEQVARKGSQYYFYLAYAHIKLNQYDEAHKAIKKGIKENNKFDEIPEMHVQGFEFLKAIIPPLDSSKSEVILEKYFLETIKARAFIRTQIAFEYYRDILIENRQYKKAYDITKEMIEITKKVMQ